ncbi:hypothetical protein [Rhodococcus spongiicola]|uniref:DUF3784 domain-containing protein n=1 Tax=Rhodococcus spongiicola TaxID=2487352 RepID=A0A3S3B3J3_9NOCA|nr:hypothetical protein [Rhodococcus spongiicola]RVW02275.1 hypothetical protein EF834_11665 [Rhodococcus spongiicola]
MKEDVVIALLFFIAAAASGLAAYAGFRGWVTDPGKGYEVPDKVQESPELSRTANALVARWCSVAAILALIPAVALVPSILSDMNIQLPLWKLAVTALYGMAVTTVGGYPFERISRL